MYTYEIVTKINISITPTFLHAPCNSSFFSFLFPGNHWSFFLLLWINLYFSRILYKWNNTEYTLSWLAGFLIPQLEIHSYLEYHHFVYFFLSSIPLNIPYLLMDIQIVFNFGLSSRIKKSKIDFWKKNHKIDMPLARLIIYKRMFKQFL